MTIHFQREIDKSKKMILSIAAEVEESLQKALKSLKERDGKLAKKVVEYDKIIDQMEIEVEEECLKILALHQPVAIDLRFIVSVLKINNDLERIGDLAANIAERALYLSGQDPIEIAPSIIEMAPEVQQMLKKSLDALVNMDTSLANEVLEADEKVDDLHAGMYEYIQEEIKKSPDSINSQLHLMGVSRYLERIADHATNIAEDVIYMVDGEISRHR
jgi:phosphate transport system protein